MPAAQDDLRAAYSFYAERNPASADRVIGSILKAANGLARFPLLGRQGRVPGTRVRTMIRFPYLLVYRVVDDTAEVLRVFHAAHAGSQAPKRRGCGGVPPRNSLPLLPIPGVSRYHSAAIAADLIHC